MPDEDLAEAQAIGDDAQRLQRIVSLAVTYRGYAATGDAIDFDIHDPYGGDEQDLALMRRQLVPAVETITSVLVGARH